MAAARVRALAPTAISNGTIAQIGAGVTGTLSLHVANGVAATNAQHRNAKFVSTGAVSAGISINGGAVTYADVSPSSPLCTTTTSGRTCTVNVGAPVGNESFAVSLFSAASGGGLLLSSGSNSTTVVAGTPFSVTVGLNPVAAGVLSSAPAIPTFTLGTPSSTTVVATFADPTGQPITGSGNVPNFLFPITIAISDSHITVTPSTVITPGQSVVIAYDGSTSVASTVNISMTANGSHIYGSSINVSTGHAIVEYSAGITAGAQVAAIAAGPDGALWFVEQAFSGQPNNIGRITTAGAVTEYAIPSANADATGITTGPDGALWFTESAGSKIGRITVGGVVTEFALNGVTASSPSGIVTGPDNNLWLASGASITQMTTSGVATSFAIPTTSSNPAGITVGPDGALWFAENGGNKIGRITTAGAITEFPVPTAGSGPLAIVCRAPTVHSGSSSS